MLTTRFFIIIVYTRWKLKEKCDVTAIQLQVHGGKGCCNARTRQAARVWRIRNGGEMEAKVHL